MTIGRETFKVPNPFLVLATQNPIETEGTYPLPEAQVDRFMLKVLVGYPNATEEFVIVERMTGALQAVQKVLTTEDLVALQAQVDKVYVDPALIEYAVRMVTATREPKEVGLQEIEHYIMFGASPRASINLILTGAGAGLCARAQLRPAAGCAGHGAGRDPASPCPFVRSAFGQCDCRRSARKRYSTVSRSQWCHSVSMPTTSAATPERILQRLDWQVIRRLDGLLQGDYRSLFYGYGVDFADLREYQPEDDIRYIDWNVTARMDTPYIRQYVEDREIYGLVPARPESVGGFWDGRATRSAGMLIDFVTTMARVLTKHGNRIGAMFAAGGNRIEHTIPARGGRMQVLRLVNDLLKQPRLSHAPFTDLTPLLEGGLNAIKRRSADFRSLGFHL